MTRIGTNRDSLKETLPLILSGFEQHQPYGGLEFHVVGNDPIQVQFNRFRQRVIDAMGRAYLPIYRMADGEFSFLVGWRAPLGQHVNPLRRLVWIAKVMRSYVGIRRVHTCWGEQYIGSVAKRARVRMIEALKIVADRGIIAAYFARRGDRWGEQYLLPAWRKFDELGIRLHERNYIPFYFVYALFSGPGRSILFKGRRILIVTSYTNERRIAIEEALAKEGVSAVEFVKISSSSAMLDDIAVPSGPFDLVLVAGGIGSVNLLAQLEVLETPAIDCGMVLECLINPEIRKNRPFLLSSEAGGSSLCEPLSSDVEIRSI